MKNIIECRLTYVDCLGYFIVIKINFASSAIILLKMLYA